MTANYSYFFELTPGVTFDCVLTLQDAGLPKNITGTEFALTLRPWPDAPKTLAAQFEILDGPNGEVRLVIPGAASKAAGMYNNQLWSGLCISRQGPSDAWTHEFVTQFRVTTQSLPEVAS